MTEWVQVAPALNGFLPVDSLIVFNGKVYGGTDSDSLPTSEGELLQWNGVDAWMLVAPEYDTSGVVQALSVFNNLLYGGYRVPGG